MSTFTPAKQFSTTAARIYRNAPPVWRLMQSLRPYICPFEMVFAHVPSKGRVLDIGCGAGISLLLLADTQEIESGHGFDASPEAIAAARTGREHLISAANVEFEIRSVEDGIPKGDWSAVLVIDVVHHLRPDRQEHFVLDVAAAVPPGGRLIVKDMSARPRWRALLNILHDLIMARQLIHHVSYEQVKQWLSAEGFNHIHSSEHNRLWYAHWLGVWERSNEVPKG